MAYSLDKQTVDSSFQLDQNTLALYWKDKKATKRTWLYSYRNLVSSLPTDFKSEYQWIVENKVIHIWKPWLRDYMKKNVYWMGYVRLKQ